MTVFISKYAKECLVLALTRLSSSLKERIVVSYDANKGLKVIIAEKLIKVSYDV